MTGSGAGRGLGHGIEVDVVRVVRIWKDRQRQSFHALIRDRKADAGALGAA